MDPKESDGVPPEVRLKKGGREGVSSEGNSGRIEGEVDRGLGSEEGHTPKAHYPLGVLSRCESTGCPLNETGWASGWIVHPVFLIQLRTEERP
jgi:hypothetical protein